MRHLHLLLLAFVFMFTAQVYAAKKNSTKVKNTRPSISAEGKIKIRMNPIKKTAVQQSDKTTSYQIYTAPPKANTGDASCPHKNAAFSPFSREGKLTQAKRTSPVTAENLRSTAIN